MAAERTLLITGAAGFIGQAAAQYFTRQGWQVVGVDRQPQPSGVPFTAYISGALEDGLLPGLLQQYPPMLCLHAAGLSSVAHSMIHPSEDFKACVPLTFSLLNTLLQLQPSCRVIFLSSAAVYGTPLALPVTEGHLVQPLSPYGFHKSIAEQVCQEFFTLYQLPTASLRIFSAYGPGLRRQVIWDICQKALHSETIQLMGTGKESRDFIHIDDIVRAIAVVSEQAPMTGEVYNLGSGQEVFIHDLAHRIVGQLSTPKKIHFDGNIPAGTPLRWQADLSKIGALGFDPKVSLEAGLATVITSLQEALLC